MTTHRVYIFGASGSGTTTLGAELARRLAIPHVDCDDHYWAASDPPFSQKRAPDERVRSMKTVLGKGGWIITGSCHGWGAEITDTASLLVFVTLDTAIRVERLKAREAKRFGDRIKPGGDMVDIHNGFMAWASQYDDPQFSGRNRANHERWYASQTVAKCRIDGVQPVASSIKQVLGHLL